MNLRRIFGKSLVLAAIYVFALQGVLAAAILAARAANASLQPQFVLCSGAAVFDGANGPAGGQEEFHGCPHCIMPGCGGHDPGVSPKSGYHAAIFAVVALVLLPGANDRGAESAVFDGRFARAPPRA